MKLEEMSPQELHRYRAFKRDVQDRVIGIRISEELLLSILTPEGMRVIKELHQWAEIDKFIQQWKLEISEANHALRCY